MKFCPDCGSKLRKNAATCKECGKNLKEEKKTTKKTTKKVENNNRKGFVIVSFILGIVSIVFAFVLTVLVIPTAVLGLIFGLLGREPKGKRKAGIIMNIIAIVLSIIMLIVWIVLISIMTKEDNPFIKFYKYVVVEDKVEGEWKCKLYNTKYSKYVLTLELEGNKKFNWSDYNSPKYNYVKGTYNYHKVDSEQAETKHYYLVNLHPTKMYLYGRKRVARDTSYKVFITKKNYPRKAKMINSRTYNIYYCDEK